MIPERGDDGALMPHLYILRCADGSFYTGSTYDLERRLAQHQLGLGANHTKKRLPVSLAFAVHFDLMVEAYTAEKRIQGWSQGKKAALIIGDVDVLKELSRSVSAPAIPRCQPPTPQ